jgi:hypothetical protein
MTDGERCLGLAYVIVALFGAGMAFVTVTRMGQGAILSRPMTGYETWIVVTGAVGGLAGLYLGSGLMGGTGLVGHLRGALGTLSVSFLGALIAGTLSLPFYGTMFGPFTLAVSLAGAPILAGLWFSNLMAAHLLIGAWRIERDTIFNRPGSLPEGVRAARVSV